MTPADGRSAAGPWTRSPAVLALDSAAGACSAAVWRHDRLAGHRFQSMLRGHSEALVPMAMEAMAEAGLGFDALDLVAVTVGPGAFTGLRIGLAAARGIGLAAGLSILGVTSFAAVAEAVPTAERTGRRLLVLLDSKRGDLFAQLLASDGAPLGSPAALAVEALAAWIPEGPLLLAGDGVPLARPALVRRAEIAYAGGGGALDAAFVARIAARRYAASGPDGPPPVPLYLRAPAVTLPGSAGR